MSLIVLPFVAGWVAIRLTQRFFFGADLEGVTGVVVFLVQAIVVSVLAAGLFSRLLQRWTPLVALFEMSLAFPDHAPSRFKLALKSSSVKKLLQAQGQVQLSSDLQTAAEQAVQLVSELAKHDRLTRGHTERVRAYADVLGQELGLSEEDLNGLRWGALLHDVGKLHVPPEILSKPGKPTAQEWEILRTHPTAAIGLLAPLKGWLGDWLLAASEHHERWDGTGYPLGLSGKEISLPGRIVAVADAYDVITSRRSYKAPATAEEARQELVRSAGSHFDPTVVRAMLETGLRRGGAVNRFGWVLEAPGIARFIQLGGQAATAAANSTVAAASTIAVAATAFSGSAEPAPLPPQIAFADQDDAAVDIEAPAPTSTIVVTTTADPTGPSTTTQIAVPLPEPEPESESEPETLVPGGVESDVPESSTSVAETTTTAPTTTTQSTPTTTPPTTGAPQQSTSTTAPTTTQPPTTTSTATSSCKILDGEDAPFEDLTDCVLRGRTIVGLDLFQADLRGVDLSGATIRDTNLNNADLRGANLRGATFVNGSAIDAAFADGDLNGASFTNFDLSRSDLSNTDLRNVRFESVSFSFAGVRNANFRGATFIGTNFNDADLRGSNFSGNDLQRVEFVRSKIEGTNFANTNNTDTVFWEAAGTPTGHATATFLRTTCPDGTFVSQSCW